MYKNYTGITNNSTKLRPLRSTIEDLFQNMTLALLSVPSLLAPQTSDTPVVSTSTSIIYRYDAIRLWTAYAAALATTVIAVAVGLGSLVISGVSYSNRFSTIVRVSRDQNLPIVIEDEDRCGQDPLPKYLGKARFFSISAAKLRKSSGGEGSSDESLRLTQLR